MATRELTFAGLQCGTEAAPNPSAQVDLESRAEWSASMNRRRAQRRTQQARMQMQLPRVEAANVGAKLDWPPIGGAQRPASVSICCGGGAGAGAGF